MYKCPLCSSGSIEEFDSIQNVLFLYCTNCELVFKAKQHFLPPEDEKNRYLLHQNDIEDPAYQQFVMPIVDAVRQNHSNTDIGLDFGAGTGPVITALLEESGYSLNCYDPFFHRDKQVLDETYDFIVCCEVIEHFHNPFEEFEGLKSILKPGAGLYCMTETRPEEGFPDWYYKDDPTHVIFYNPVNLEWIRENFGFSKLEITGRLVSFIN